MSTQFFCGGSDREMVRDYSNLSRLYDLMYPKKEDKMQLSDEDLDEIRRLTGDHGQGHVFFDGDDDDEELDYCFSYAEKLGFSVRERLEGQRFRKFCDMLRFDSFDLWGNYNPTITDPLTGDKWKKVEFFRNWLNKTHKTMRGYVLAVLGKTKGEWFMRQLQKMEQDPQNPLFGVDQILGIVKETEPTGTKKPGRAWFQEHKLDSEKPGHKPDDGRMADEIEDRGWVQDPDTGAWSSTGYPIPYLRDADGQVVEIQTKSGLMKVLNINICVGTKPCLEFYNLVKLAYDAGVTRTMRQEVIRRKLLSMYQAAMRDRQPDSRTVEEIKKEALPTGIMTCQNGKRAVYYKLFVADGQSVCVFSPIPMRDLRDDKRKLIEKRVAEYRARKALWDDRGLVQG